MPTTMKDIAALAGVSVGTVDRALNHRGRIAPDVEKRILLIAEQMHYRTNSLAKSLTNIGKDLKIAVVLHIYQNDFYTDIMNGITRAAHDIADLGITVESYHSRDFDARDQLHQIRTAIEHGASALVIVPINHPLIIEELKRLHKENFPVIFLSSILDEAPCFSAVRCDYQRSGMIAAGLVRIIMAGKGNVLIFHPSLSQTAHQLRIRSFRETLEAHSENLVLKGVVELPNDSFDNYKITSQELAKNPNVDCVVYCGSARAGLKALQDCKRPIHSIFYDCAPQTKQALEEGLIDAAILQNPQEQGYRAIKVLSDYLTLKKMPDSIVTIDHQIWIKESILSIR